MRALVCVKCVLCEGWLPANKDDILQDHMKHQHRVFSNLAFLLSACFLDGEGIKQTMIFINKRISSVKGEESDNQEDPDEDATMEEKSDISHHDVEMDHWIDYNKDTDTTLVNEVSVESSPSMDGSYQDVPQCLEPWYCDLQSEPREEQCSLPESLAESLADHHYSKMCGSPANSEERTELNKTNSKINGKKRKAKSILKTSLLTSSSVTPANLDVNKRKQRIVGDCNGAPVFYMPEPKMGEPQIFKNIKYRQNDDGQSQDLSDVSKEELDDMKNEELEDDVKPYLSSTAAQREKKYERLRALCLEECGEKKAGEAEPKHLRVYHGGVRPFPCPNCPKKFKKFDQLEFHQKRRHHPKSHICDICGKQFAGPHYTTAHKKTVHMEKEETHPCDVCGKVFTSETNLRNHKKRTHSENSVSQCSLCGIKMRPQNYKV